jgi:iron complex transport system ATP-binding protein
MPSIATKNLSLKIANKILCTNLNWQVAPGQIWGILGANGSGKTTLLHTLAGLQTPESGEIFLQEKSLATFSYKARARQMGILFQDTSDVFPQTVFEFCCSGRYPYLKYFSNWHDEDKERVHAALTLMELEKNLTQNVNTLSGGERRRLAIATLLTQAPQIYLLDEPTNHLDLYHQFKVLEQFKLLAAQGTSIIMTLHDVNLAAHYCDFILMLWGDGDCLQQPTAIAINQLNLERLYQCAFNAVEYQNKKWWVSTASQANI